VTLDIPVPEEFAGKTLQDNHFSKPAVEEAVPTSLPVAPLLSQTYLESVEDQEHSISLDNSVVFGDDDDDGSGSICVVEGEEEGESKEERKAVEDVPINSSINLNLNESQDHPETPEESPTSFANLALARPLPLGGALAMRSDKMKMAQEAARKNGARDHMSSFMREEVARVTSRTRTKQEKEFLEDVLGDGNKSSSLSDSDWKDESLLPLA